MVTVDKVKLVEGSRGERRGSCFLDPYGVKSINTARPPGINSPNSSLRPSLTIQPMFEI